MSVREYARRSLAIAIWAFLVWGLLTWTATAEQLTFGAVLSLGCGLTMAPLGSVAAPWTALAPRRLFAMMRLGGYAAVRIVSANVGLARRILSPSRPLRSGMLIVPTSVRTGGELAATGIITSLIVDNQIVDLDRSEDELQYHAVAVPEGERSEAINAPVERRIAAVRSRT